MSPLLRLLGSAVTGLTLLNSSCAPSVSADGNTAYDRFNQRENHYDDAARLHQDAWKNGPAWGGSSSQPVTGDTLKGMFGRRPPN